MYLRSKIFKFGEYTVYVAIDTNLDTTKFILESDNLFESKSFDKFSELLNFIG